MTGDQHDAEEVVTGELVDDGDSTQQEAAPEGREESIDEPTQLLRVAGMVKGLLKEVETTELDEAARERLGTIHTRSVEMLRQVMSDDLVEELDEVVLDLGDDVPSGSELRVAQAQLAGWLEGLFHGIQASMASRQMAQQQGQLQKMLQQGGQQQEGGSPTGQYL
ncbi:MAG: proteasome activator [Nitriliruptorales bacterium]|nr:proteasome activator [Nitriliruptorales bacterium]